MVAVFVENQQSDRPLEHDRYGNLASAVLSSLGVEGDVEVSVLFVDEATIGELALRHLGHGGPTDVLSFPIDTVAFTPLRADADPPARSAVAAAGIAHAPGGSAQVPHLLGDVLICPAVAVVNAPDHAGTYEDELALLVVHGLLHLLGYDHEDPTEADVMEAQEQLLLGAHWPPAVGGP